MSNTGCPDLGMREMKTVVIVGCYLGAGQMLRVPPVHVVRTVVIHVNQLVCQDCPHLLLSEGEVGADDHLVVSEVIPTHRQVSGGSEVCLASPSSQTSITRLTDDVSSEVKLTALALQSSDQSPHQGRPESPGHQDLTLSRRHHVI